MRLRLIKTWLGKILWEKPLEWGKKVKYFLNDLTVRTMLKTLLVKSNETKPIWRRKEYNVFVSIFSLCRDVMLSLTLQLIVLSTPYPNVIS